MGQFKHGAGASVHLSSKSRTDLRAVAVINSESGTMRNTDVKAFSEHLKKRYEARHAACTIKIVTGEQAGETLRDVAGSQEFDVLIAVGGDGTISGAAELAWKHKKILGVIPAGTMNLYAQTLGMPLEVFEAAEVLADSDVRDADIGLANGKPFVHQFCVGLQPRVVIERSKLAYNSRFSKMLASLRASLGAFLNPPSFPAEVLLDDKKLDGRYSVIAVSNNLYGEGHLPYADDPGGNILGFYSAPVLSAGENARLGADLLTGQWRRNPHLSVRQGRSVVLRFPRLKRDAKAVLDGELVPLEAEVKIQIEPGALKVLSPK